MDAAMSGPLWRRYVQKLKPNDYKELQCFKLDSVRECYELLIIERWKLIK